MARMIRISMPCSERMYKAARLDCDDGIKNAIGENDKAWWKKHAARIERRWKKHLEETGSGSLKANPAPKPTVKRRRKADVESTAQA